MSTASGHSLFNQLNPVTHTGTLCDLPSPESRTWPQSSSSRDPAGPHKHTMQRFIVLKVQQGSHPTPTPQGIRHFAPSRKTCRTTLLIHFAALKENCKCCYLLHQNIKEETQPELQLGTDPYLGSCPAGVQLGFIHRKAMMEKFKHKFFFKLSINH